MFTDLRINPNPNLSPKNDIQMYIVINAWALPGFAPNRTDDGQRIIIIIIIIIIN